MKERLWPWAAVAWATLTLGEVGWGATVTNTSRSDLALAQYFQAETKQVSERCLADIHKLSDWTSRRGEYRRQLQEMLGLWPLPERGDLKPVITGKLEHPEFTVEKLHFQASPGLYVTGNLYLPRGLDKPAPTILYVCGHSRVVTNGVSCGNKAGYQHHGAWFARNGYVCLLIDTVQLGEIEGAHRGTHSENQWWWNSRGYTPAGVEAWFGIRALDYLCSRPEVDQERIGLTGRSGGGSYTWTVAALDERVKVAVPVAGITDLQNHVVDGTVEGHCDCMFFVNTYRWDFAQVAALLAPRPLLIGNSDKDRIFPLDGVVRLHEQVRRIYELYGATAKLGLLITEGPHADTQDLQVPVFRWFNRWLKGEQPLVEMAAVKFFAPEELRVFDRLPADAINRTVQESFVPQATPGELGRAELVAVLREKVFGGWPADPPRATPTLCAHAEQGGLRYQAYEFTSQANVDLGLHLLEDTRVKHPERIVLWLVDTPRWNLPPFRDIGRADWATDSVSGLRDQMVREKMAVAFFAPRLVDPVELSGKPPKEVAQIRRRFMLLGQTLDGMRVWDIRCAVQALRGIAEFQRLPIWIKAREEMGVNAAYAALFEPDIAYLQLAELPRSPSTGPDYLNVMRFTDLPQILQLLGPRLAP